MKFRYISCVFFSIFFVSCSPGSLEDFRHEGQSVCRDIIKDLQKIQSREDLTNSEPVLKKKFEKLTQLMIQARQFQIDNPELADSLAQSSGTQINDLLKEELQRIYAMEGGKEIIERAQREAMLRLDSFEKMKIKQKELRIK